MMGHVSVGVMFIHLSIRAYFAAPAMLADHNGVPLWQFPD